MCVDTHGAFSSLVKALVLSKKEKERVCCQQCDSPGLQTLCFEWPGAAPPLSWLAGEPADGSICTCLGCSALWCSPCTRWPSSRCCPPCRPPSGERSGSRPRPSCSYRAGILGRPGERQHPECWIEKTPVEHFLCADSRTKVQLIVAASLIISKVQISIFISVLQSQLPASGWLQNHESTMTACSFRWRFFNWCKCWRGG